MRFVARSPQVRDPETAGEEKMRRIFVAAALSVLPLVASAQVNLQDCADTVDKMRRVARDAGYTAEDLRSGRERLATVQEALEDVEGRLRRAMRECGMNPIPAVPKLGDPIIRQPSKK